MALRGERIGTAYVKILADGSGLDESVERQMEGAQGAFDEGGREGSETYWDAFEKETKKNEKFERSLEKKFEKSKAKFDALGEALGGSMQESIAEHMTDIFRMRGQDEVNARKYGDRAGELWAEGFARTGSRAFNDMDLGSRAFATIEEESRRAAAELKKLNDKAEAGGSKFDRFSVSVGKTFGKGSRNNFVNAIGSMMGGLTKIGMKVLNVGGYFEKFTDMLGQGLTTLAEKGGTIGKVAGVVAKVGPSLAAAGGGLAFVIAVLGPVTGLISGLAAAITALATSVAFALSAGLGLFVGLVPLAAGAVAAFVIAIKGLKDIQGFDKYVEPFKTIGSDIKKNLAGGLFEGLKEGKTAFLDLFRTIRPFSKVIGESLGNVVSSFAEFTKGPEFKTFYNAFRKFLPGAIESFGKIAENIFGGLGGIFAGAQPMVQEFLGWLTGVTEEFSEWANSPEGQNKIKEFFDKASESAKKIGEWIGKVGELIGKVFFSDEGKKAGDSIIDSMSKKLEDFIAWIQENQENGNLAKWFEDGQDIIGKVGTAIEDLTVLFDKLDTPENRQLVEDLFDAFHTVMPWVSRFVGWLEKLQPLINPIIWIIKWVRRMIPIWKQAWEEIKKFVERAKEKLNDFKEKVREVKEDIRDKLNQIRDFFRELPGRIWGALQDAIGKIGDFVGKVREKFNDMKEAIRGKLEEARGWIRDKVAQFPDAVASAGSKFLQAGKDLIGQFWDGLKDIGGGIGEFASSMMSAVRSAINDALDLPLTIDYDKGFVHIHATLIPAFAKGVKNFPGGLALVGEQGPEVVGLPPGSDVFGANDPTTRMFRQTNNTTTNNVNNTPAGRTVEIGGITIITPTEEPMAVARETVNQMVASAYF